MLSRGICEMTDIGEALMDYTLLADVAKAEKAGLFDKGVHGENEDRHISLLDDLLRPLDGKEVYVTVRNLVKYHRTQFARTLEYMEKEGE